MKKRWMGMAIAALFCSLSVNAQVGVWKNYTSMKSVRSLARSGNMLWAATSGGLFSWTEGSAAFAQYTNAQGLRDFDVTTVAVDGNGDIWAGSSKGIIHVYTPSTGRWRYVFDFLTARETNKRINNLFVQGDTLLIGTPFGLSIFFIQRFQFGDTYRKFGTSFPDNVKLSVTSSVIYGGRLWAIVSDGRTFRVAVGDVSSPNLGSPGAWVLWSIGSGAEALRALTVFNNRVYVAAASGLYFFGGNSWTQVPSLAGRNVTGAAASGTLLTSCNSDSTVDTLGLSDTGGRFGTPLPDQPTSIVIGSGGRPVVGSQNNGMLSYDGGWTGHLPNGPGASQFTSVAVDGNGFVWGASGSRNGKGFYRYNGRDWKSFSRENSHVTVNEYYRVSVTCNGSAWASSWGGGIVEMPVGIDSVDTSRIYGRNVGMFGIPGFLDYIVTSSVHCDSRGNIWFTSRDAANGRVFVVRTPAGGWHTIPAQLPNGTSVTRFQDDGLDRSLTFDAFGNLWGVIRDDQNKGIVSFGRPGAGSGDIGSISVLQGVYYLSGSNGLPSSEVRTIVTDRDDNIWVGTDKGIAIILDPSNPTRAGAIASYRPLNGLVINCIAVDPLDQKWVGTTEGALLLSRDGTQQIAFYDVDNTDGKLIDNDIKSIAIDQNSGTVYFGTVYGLASVTTTAAAPKASFDRLVISPNPYRVPNVTPLSVDGLMENSTLKILTVDGKLVREVKTPGGRIGFWDGKDEAGKDVATGVYLVVAFSEKDGTNVGKGKVAVVRQR